jgi:hypothetical protein
MRTGRWILAALLVLVAGCGEDPVAPLLEAVLPARGAPGSAVELVGERFEGSPRSASFGGKEAAILEWQPRRARARVPELAPGSTVVVVMVEGRASAPLSFYVEGSVRLDGGR